MSTVDIAPSAGPGKAVLITDRIADTIVSLSSLKTGGSKLVTLDLGINPDAAVVLATHAPRI